MKYGWSKIYKRAHSSVSVVHALSRKCFLGIGVVTCGAGLLSAFAPNYVTLVIFRGLVGFGLAGGPVYFTWFLEFVPVTYRGMWMVVFSLFWTAGTILEAGLAWVGTFVFLTF